MKIAMRSLSASVLITLILIASSYTHAAEKKLIMGLASAESNDTTIRTWAPLLKDMAAYIGIPVQGVRLDDYAGVIWYMGTGRAQIAWIGNKAAIEAVDRANAEIVAQSITLLGPGYHAHLITRADSPLDNEQDVLDNARHLVFGNGDPNSTSGFLVPGYYVFATHGVTPSKIFKRMTHNNHEGNFHDVAAGRVDVATSNSSALARYRVRYPEEFEKIKVIWTSPLIPSDPILVNKDLPVPLKHRIAEFLAQYARSTPGKGEAQLRREQAVLLRRKWTGFQLSDNSQLIPIRKLELYKKRLSVEQDTTLTPKARDSRLKIIDRQLEALSR